MKQLLYLKNALMALNITMIFCACSSGKKIPAHNTTTEPDAPLTETYWKVTELMGQPVTTNADMKKEMHLILKLEGTRVQGFSGCNTFMGSYTLVAGNRLSFSKMAGTMMACPNLEQEQQLLEILSRVDNYAIKGHTLSLHKAKMAPLARLEAVVMK